MLEVALKVLEVVLYMLEAVNDVRCGLMVLLRMLLCILQAAEGKFCLLDVLE